MSNWLEITAFKPVENCIPPPPSSSVHQPVISLSGRLMVQDHALPPLSRLAPTALSFVNRAAAIEAPRGSTPGPRHIRPRRLATWLMRRSPRSKPTAIALHFISANSFRRNLAHPDARLACSSNVVALERSDSSSSTGRVLLWSSRFSLSYAVLVNRPSPCQKCRPAS